MRGQKLSKIHFLILLSLLGFISPLQSQEYKFRTLGVEDGLSQITVSDICQDEKSRIWIATLDGLNCFDGNHIKVFNHFHNDSISYGNLYVTQMVEDGQGSLFLLTSTGLFQFDLETEKYYILPVPSPSTLAKGKLGVWIAEGGKLFLYDKNTHVCGGTFAGHRADNGRRFGRKSLGCFERWRGDACGYLWIDVALFARNQGDETDKK